LPPLAERSGRTCGRTGVGLPFGYRVRREGGLLILRRPDGAFVAAFFAACADPFEIEARVWEDAD
jgi:hypothetical protein